MLSLQDHINQLADMFERKEVGEGENKRVIVTFADNAHEELKNSVYEAHDGNMPRDWVFEKYLGILESLGNYNIDSMDDIEEHRSEIVDGEVDSYTSDLTDWLNSSVYNVEYLGLAVSELGASDGFAILAGAQYLAIDEVFGHVLELLEKVEE